MPSYDVSAVCRGAVDEKECVNLQYNARDLVSGEWLHVSPAARAECIAADRWGDYETLWTCIASHRNDAKVMGR